VKKRKIPGKATNIWRTENFVWPKSFKTHNTF